MVYRPRYRSYSKHRDIVQHTLSLQVSSVSNSTTCSPPFAVSVLFGGRNRATTFCANVSVQILLDQVKQDLQTFNCVSCIASTPIEKVSRIPGWAFTNTYAMAQIAKAIATQSVVARCKEKARCDSRFKKGSQSLDAWSESADAIWGTDV